MLDRETTVVFTLFVALVVATVLPFALPALRIDDGGISQTPTPAREGVDGVTLSGESTPHPTLRTPDRSTRRNDTRKTIGEATGDASGTGTRTTLTEPTVQCDGRSSDGVPDSFPLTVGGDEVTGDDVSVAVVDPSGFDIDDPRIEDNVVATESFWSGGSLDVGNDGANRHGTESAAIVARIAPDADLLLANFRKAYDFRNAVEWAIERDVDLIVAPVTFYAKPNDGSAPVSRAVTEATEQGIPVVVPTGNVATKHWEGTYRGGPWLEFEPNDTRMYLRGSDRPAQVWLWWNRSEDTERHDFQIVLYRHTGDGSERIATSRDYPKGPVGTNQVLFESIRTNHLLSKSIANGTYYIRIEGPADATHRIELVAAAHPLEAPVAEGSLMAPATASGDVIAVGAGQMSSARPLETSSRGPTNDGRPGIDLLAPGRVKASNGVTFTGTSAATAYTGGVVALLKDVGPELTPARAESILQTTASPTAENRSLATGYGTIDPVAALRCLS